MTRDEVIDVLTVAANFDNRQPSAAATDAWEVAIGDLDAADAKLAVALYYRENRQWIMPADVRAGVRKMRGERIALAVIPAPPPELCDDPRAYQRALQAGIAQAAEGRAPLAADLPRPLAIDAPARGPREIQAPPQRLGAAMAQLRRVLGPARARQAPLASPQEIARRKAAESRTEREAREQAEGSQAS
jgi:hypothetical protein